MPINTKKVIANTFLTTLDKKSIDKITIKEIIDECGISRPAFYYHFRDIFDLAEWAAEKIIADSIEKNLKNDDPVEKIKCFISAAVEHKNSLRKMLSSMRYEQVSIETIRSYLIKLLNKNYPDILLTPYDTEVTLLFIAHGISGILLSFDSNKPFDIHRFSEQIFQTMSTQLNLPPNT